MPPVSIRKNYGHTVSVIKGSNKIIACSKVDWGPIKIGSIIAIEDDNDFYKITHKNKTSYYKEVRVLNSSQLRIEGHTGSNLSINDSIIFTNDEYEIVSASVIDPGEGYEAGDILIPKGGVLRYNSMDGNDLPAELKVESVNENGGIEKVSVKSKGVYNLLPPADGHCKGGKGKNQVLSLSSSPSEKRTTEERTISDIEYKEDHTVMYLNHPLPPRLHNGSISVTKWEVSISTEYLGENRYDAGYEIFKDFTPHLNLPIVRGNIAANYLLYNEGMMILDKKIKELEEKIDLLS